VLQNQPLLAARTSANQTAGSLGSLLDPEAYIVESATAETSWGAGLLSDAAVLVGTPQTFEVLSPELINGFFPVLARVPWVLQAAAGGGGAFGTIQVDLMVDGVSVASGLGAPRDITVAALATRYVELVELRPAASFQVPPGGTLGIMVTPIVTTASGAPGSTYEPRLRHNPQAIDDQFVIELQGARGADLRS